MPPFRFLSSVLVLLAAMSYLLTGKTPPDNISHPTPTLTTQGSPATKSTHRSKLFPALRFELLPLYTIEETTKQPSLLTIKKTPTARIEIFRMSDFGSRPIDYKENETQIEIDARHPKAVTTIGGYNVWLFFPENSTSTATELLSIVRTITITPLTGNKN